MIKPASQPGPLKAIDNRVIQVSSYSAESQRTRSETEAFLCFVSRMKGSVHLIWCRILSGSLDGFWSGHAAFISEEKKDSIWKLKKHFAPLLSADKMSASVELFFLLMVQMNYLSRSWCGCASASLWQQWMSGWQLDEILVVDLTKCFCSILIVT